MERKKVLVLALSFFTLTSCEEANETDSLLLTCCSRPHTLITHKHTGADTLRQVWKQRAVITAPYGEWKVKVRYLTIYFFFTSFVAHLSVFPFSLFHLWPSIIVLSCFMRNWWAYFWKHWLDYISCLWIHVGCTTCHCENEQAKIYIFCSLRLEHGIV